MSGQPEPSQTDAADDDLSVPLLTAPAEGVPAVIDELSGLRGALRTLAAGDGPVAIDAERAHAFRYSHRAYLIQLRRRGAGTMLLDPAGLPSDTDTAGQHEARSSGGTSDHGQRVHHPRSTAKPADLSAVSETIHHVEWVVHAANQDLPCLVELGLLPHQLFDTELAARLLGYPRVNLGTLLEKMFGVRLLKEHSAADWSTRPLPSQWLAYAALDVELLLELRDALADQLRAAGKDEWARQEFAWLAVSAGAPAEARPEPWRRTSGLHRIRSTRGLAIVAELWHTRDRIAHRTDLAPGRLLPDSGLIEAALLARPSRRTIADLPAFRRRPARRHLDSWTAAISTALQKSERDLPPIQRQSDDPPQQARAWASKDPQAAERLQRIRAELATKATELDLPLANLLTPQHLRRLLWRPPAEITEAQVNDQLAGYGARPWQREHTVPVITRLLREPAG